MRAMGTGEVNVAGTMVSGGYTRSYIRIAPTHPFPDEVVCEVGRKHVHRQRCAHLVRVDLMKGYELRT